MEYKMRKNAGKMIFVFLFLFLFLLSFISAVPKQSTISETGIQIEAPQDEYGRETFDLPGGFTLIEEQQESREITVAVEVLKSFFNLTEEDLK